MILAIDQGTTGTTCLVVAEDRAVAGRGYAELPQHFPQPGLGRARSGGDLAERARRRGARRRGLARRVDAIGITNQRETTLLWDRATGRPVAPAIVWQDRRTAERCRELDADLIRERTGLVPDPYFSATKLEWLLARARVADGTRVRHGRQLARLEADARRGARDRPDERVAHAARVAADARLGRRAARALRRRPELLPRIVGSAEPVGEGELLGAPCQIRGIAGDQQAALYGQGCHAAGEGKATYGTGTFVLVHTGDDASAPPHGLLKTAAADGYAHEGAVLVGGAALQWLRDGLGLLAAAAESEALAESVDSTGGVVFVPALTGLGSPWWDADARGLIAGLTRGTTEAHLVRAALEAIAHQVADVVDALPEQPSVLRVDGGATENGFLMQFQADLLGIPVEVAAERETTALGAAALAAGRGARVAVGAVYEPRLSRDAAVAHRLAWTTALNRSRT